jgi:hypothetical protein
MLQTFGFDCGRPEAKSKVRERTETRDTEVESTVNTEVCKPLRGSQLQRWISSSPSAEASQPRHAAMQIHRGLKRIGVNRYEGDRGTMKTESDKKREIEVHSRSLLCWRMQNNLSNAEWKYDRPTRARGRYPTQSPR